MTSPSILVFDSGLGGLTVYREIVKILPHCDFYYGADIAGFPYGDWAPDLLVSRIADVIGDLSAKIQPDIVVIACNTASTIALAPLREMFDLPFVGTVPAIKVAAQRTRSKMISVLATPGTVSREYTRDLIDQFAATCDVELVGSQELAKLAEDKLRGKTIDMDHVARALAPVFIRKGDRRTDMVVLACTHFPLLRAEFESIWRWPVEFIDPAPAIARQVETVLAALGPITTKPDSFRRPEPDTAYMTAPAFPVAGYDGVWKQFGFSSVKILSQSGVPALASGRSHMAHGSKTKSP